MLHNISVFSQSEYVQLRLRFRLGARLHLLDLHGGLSVMDILRLQLQLESDLLGLRVLIGSPQPPPPTSCSDF